METAVTRQKLLVDEALLTVLIRAFKRLITGVSCEMHIETRLVRQLLVAKATNPFLVWLQVTSHVLIVRVLRHVYVAKATAEHFWILAELKLASVRFVLLEAWKRQAAELAVANVKDAEINFGSSTFFVEAWMLGDATVSCVLFTACLTHVTRSI